MFSLSSSQQYFLYSQPTDMRKSFDGLCGLVSSKMGRNPTSGEVFIFIGTRKDAIKLLHWESGGLVLYYKRLEKGTFELSKSPAERNTLPISWPSLVLLIEGIKVEKYRQKPRLQAR
jgi:transposase